MLRLKLMIQFVMAVVHPSEATTSKHLVRLPALVSWAVELPCY